MSRPDIPIASFLAVSFLLSASAGRAQQSSSDTAKPQAPSSAQTSNQQQAPNQQPSQSGQTFRREVNLVDVLFTVLNRRNKLVPDLEQGDFKVFDEGKAQEIRYFSKQTDLPLRIGMLLDTSNSIRDRIKFEQDASV